MHDFHIWTFTGNSIGAGDIDKIYAGIQPSATTGITEYLNRATNEGSGTTADDRTANNRDGTITGGVTHKNETTTLLPFASTYKTVEDVPIYAGILSQVDRVIKPGQEVHKLDILGLQTILNYKLYLYSGSTSFTRTADPAVMIKEILDFYPDYFYYDGSSIPNYGTTLSIQFDNVRCFDAIKTILDTTGRSIQRDADGLVTFFNQSASPTADHVLDFRKDIVEITKKEDRTEVVNSVKVKRASGTVTASDAASQALYGVLEAYVDASKLNNSTTANAFASAYIVKYKNPKAKIAIEVNSNYDIGSIKPGNAIKLQGDPTSIGTRYIDKLEFTPSSLKIWLDDLDSLEKSLASL